MEREAEIIDLKWGIEVLLALFLYFIELLNGAEMIFFFG